MGRSRVYLYRGSEAINCDFTAVLSAFGVVDRRSTVSGLMFFEVSGRGFAVTLKERVNAFALPTSSGLQAYFSIFPLHLVLIGLLAFHSFEVCRGQKLFSTTWQTALVIAVHVLSAFWLMLRAS